MLDIEPAILIFGVLLFVGILASRLSERLSVPSLLLFLGVGMLAGSEGIGGIAFESPDVAYAIGTIALCVILYAERYKCGVRNSECGVIQVWSLEWGII